MPEYYPAPSIATDTLHVTADADVDGNLNVDGTAQIDGDTVVGADKLTVAAATGNLDTDGDVTVGGDLNGVDADNVADAGNLWADRSTFFGSKRRFERMTGLSLASGGLYLCDEASGSLHNSATNGTVLAAATTPLYEQWIGGFKGVGIDSASEGFGADVHAPGVASQLVVHAFSVPAHVAGNLGLVGRYRVATDVGWVAYVDTSNDKVVVYANDGAGGPKTATFATALTFGSVYALVVQIDRAAAVIRATLRNVTAGTSESISNLDITGELTYDDTQTFQIGYITGAFDAATTYHLGTAVLVGAQIEGAGVIAALITALRI